MARRRSIRISSADQGQVPEALVEEGGVEGGVLLVAGGPTGGIDLEAPRQVGGTAEHLLVEPVAQPADGLGQGQRGCHRVEPHGQADALAVPDVDPDRHAGDDAAGDPETALPQLQGVERTIGEVGRPVGDDVVEAGPDQTCGHRPHADRPHVVGIALAGPPPSGRQLEAGQDPERDHQAVGVERPDRVGARARDGADHTDVDQPLIASGETA